MAKTETIKSLENLYSWAEFYSTNGKWDNYNKCENQIIEFKKLHNLN